MIFKESISKNFKEWFFIDKIKRSKYICEIVHFYISDVFMIPILDENLSPLHLNYWFNCLFKTFKFSL